MTVNVMRDRTGDSHRLGGVEGDMRTNCSVGSWIGSWNGKRSKEKSDRIQIKSVV